MANPTTNFGWVMPTSTDLVTDLPADFNVFGQGVDTSLQYLLGGTTGQVLSKTSNTSMAFTWVTPTDQTPLTTKGDLFTFTTVDARLGVGANDTVLTADSTAATGLKWATPAGSSGPAFQAYSTPTQSISTTTNTKATMTNENFDTDNNFASSRFTPTKAGYYMITGAISFTGGATKTYRVLLYKNGSGYPNWNTISLGVAVANPTLQAEALIYCNGSTDYIELYGWTDATSPEFYLSTMQGVWIRS